MLKEQVIAELEKLNKKADVIIGIMQTPENKLLNFWKLSVMPWEL